MHERTSPRLGVVKNTHYLPLLAIRHGDILTFSNIIPQSSLGDPDTVPGIAPKSESLFGKKGGIAL